MVSHPKFELHKNYSLAEVRSVLGPDFARSAGPPRPRRPVPTTLEELEPENRDGVAALADIICKFLSPGYSLYLTGSRAKGYWLDDSDWDIIILGGGCTKQAAVAIKSAAAEQGYALDLWLATRPPLQALLFAAG